MAAVLQDAVECFQQYVFAESAKEKKLFQDAEDWILEKNTDWFFSFESICGTLQLHPDYLRQGLLSWKKAKGNERSVQEYRADRKKFVETRVAHTSVGRSKTA